LDNIIFVIIKITTNILFFRENYLKETLEDENYISLIEIIISKNSDKKYDEICDLFEKLVEKGFIDRDYFYTIKGNGYFLEIVDRYRKDNISSLNFNKL
jgi:hypothetical protein